MSLLANKTETAAIQQLVRCLKYFDALADKKMTVADDFAATTAAQQIRSIIETNGFDIVYRAGKYLIRNGRESSYNNDSEDT